MRSAITPATITPVPNARCRPKRSFKIQLPSRAANSTEVSRNAATEATGARVIAHSAIAYEPIDAAMALPSGRGPGHVSDDLYAFGVTLVVLLAGGSPAPVGSCVAMGDSLG